MKKRILIIEDEFPMLTILSKKMEESGFEVLTAMDGEIGLQKALTQNPDLILLDIILPKMDGLTLLDNYILQKPENRAPIIVLSNLDSIEKMEESHKKGVHNYLVKTNWTLDEVVAKVEKIVG